MAKGEEVLERKSLYSMLDVEQDDWKGRNSVDFQGKAKGGDN